MTNQISLSEQKKINEYMEKCHYAKKILETQIEILIDDFSFKRGYNPIEHIKGRIKSEKSVLQKLERYNKEYTASNLANYVKDIVGIRIVCSFLSDVFDMVFLLTHCKNIIIKEREDYIKNPKDTGYMSYHLQVLVPIYLQEHVDYIECEIQVRTMAMDFWATLDHKISYKFQKVIPDEVKNQMYDYAQIIQELDKKMMDLNTLVQKYKKEL
ncbi:MAG: GTP pyrophosphokinase family protein [Bacilli bacterium]|nr:GTP pyrophosphokinase family protein [Bacilli bacterium]